MRSSKIRWAVLCCSLLFADVFAPRSVAVADDQPTAPAEKTERSRADLEQQFSEQLTGSVMVGRFTIIGRNDDKVPKPERYEIQSARKANGDTWIFTTRIEYGGKKKTLPIPVPVTVLWAGDTPIITLTETTIPGMGTFSARVLFHGDRYAGSWQHDNVGGHMWGVIESKPTETP